MVPAPWRCSLAAEKAWWSRRSWFHDRDREGSLSPSVSFLAPLSPWSFPHLNTISFDFKGEMKTVRWRETKWQGEERPEEKQERRGERQRTRGSWPPSCSYSYSDPSCSCFFLSMILIQWSPVLVILFHHLMLQWYPGMNQTALMIFDPRSSKFLLCSSGSFMRLGVYT